MFGKERIQDQMTGWIKCKRKHTESQKGFEFPIWVVERKVPQINTTWETRDKRY